MTKMQKLSFRPNHYIALFLLANGSMLSCIMYQGFKKRFVLVKREQAWNVFFWYVELKVYYHKVYHKGEGLV